MSRSKPRSLAARARQAQRKADIAAQEAQKARETAMALEKRIHDNQRKSLLGIAAFDLMERDRDIRRRLTEHISATLTRDDERALFGLEALPGGDDDGRTWLNVPRSEKALAKPKGARWDSVRGRWYAPAGTDLEMLAPWLPQA